MKEDMLFQFVGFETTVSLDDFSEQWETFAKKFFNQDIHTITLQQQVRSRNRFRYVSMNEWPQDNFRFTFMEGRGSDYFPDHRVKVVQAGGYVPIHTEAGGAVADEVKILAFLNDEEHHNGHFHKWPFTHVNVYQAYYQSCLYNFILEFYTAESDAAMLIAQIKKRFPHADAGIYRECLVLQG